MEKHTKNNVVFHLIMVCVLVSLPLSSYAYLDPATVFGGLNTPFDGTSGSTSSAGSNSSVDYKSVPVPNFGSGVRNAEANASAQNAAANSQRAYYNQSQFTDPNYSTTFTIPSSSAAPGWIVPATDDPCAISALSEACIYQKRMNALAQQQSSPVIVVGQDGQITDGNGKVLHSGAPIASTGPADQFAAILLLIAAIVTLIPVLRRRPRESVSLP